jgi:cell division protein FtsI/penicillin-binding protein 2
MMAAVVDTGTGRRLKKIYRQQGQFRAAYTLPEGRSNALIGKTGTAETGTGSRDHAWFVAVAPRDAPRYALAVVIEHGGLGATAAGPVAVEVMVQVLNRMPP